MNSKENPVLHIITGLATGGAERYLRRLLAAGLNETQPHHVLSLTDEGTQGEHIRSLGVSVHTLNLKSGLPSLRSLQKLRETVRHIAPAIIQGWMYHGNLAAYWAARGMRTNPVQVWNIRQSLHALRMEKPLTRLVIQVSRGLSKRPAAIIYNSAAARAQHENYGFHSQESQTIYNGFDLAVFQPNPVSRARIRKELGISQEAMVIGNISRFHPVKNHSELVATVARCMAEDPSLHLLLAGPGVDTTNQRLQTWCSAIPQGRVHLLGEREDVHDLLPAMDVYCSSSLAEAFPNAVGEAMACAIPCVVTNVGDSAHLVGSSGWVVAADDADPLAAALTYATKLPPSKLARFGQLARQRIEKIFPVHQSVQRYVELYNRLTHGSY